MCQETLTAPLEKQQLRSPLKLPSTENAKKEIYILRENVICNKVLQPTKPTIICSFKCDKKTVAITLSLILSLQVATHAEVI